MRAGLVGMRVDRWEHGERGGVQVSHAFFFIPVSGENKTKQKGDLKFSIYLQKYQG